MTREEKLDLIFERIYNHGYAYAAGYLETLVRTYIPDDAIDHHYSGKSEKDQFPLFSEGQENAAHH